jgi:2-methylcitrate dehydratase PrpD
LSSVTTLPVIEPLAAYITDALKRPLPSDVHQRAIHHFADTIGAMASGSRLPAGRIAAAFVETHGGAGRCHLMASPTTTTPIMAAFANGMSAHADETDDSHAPSLSHPGCGIVPAVLAAAELVDANGTDILRATVLGYDISSRINRSLNPAEFREAGHSTHSIGPTFGAASAAAALLGLNPSQVRHALSYAAQQASGLSCWMRDPDHIEKSFDFAGMPARNGLSAALMVSSGFTGVDDVFTGPRGFFDAFDESQRTGLPVRPELLIEGLGDSYEIMLANIKRWSVGSPIQAALDAIERIIARRPVRPEDVINLKVSLPEQGADTVDSRDAPDICAQHLCAVMLIDGIVTFASSHDTARMSDPRVLDIRRRVTLVGSPELTRAMPSRQAIVELHRSDGSYDVEHVRDVRGTWSNPMTADEVQSKVSDLVAPAIGEAQATALIEKLWSLDESVRVSDLFV